MKQRNDKMPTHELLDIFRGELADKYTTRSGGKHHGRRSWFVYSKEHLNSDGPLKIGRIVKDFWGAAHGIIEEPPSASDDYIVARNAFTSELRRRGVSYHTEIKTE